MGTVRGDDEPARLSSPQCRLKDENIPMFSVLLPSRDRLVLLKLAIRSVREQDFEDFEIVVSDNASSQDYRGYVESLADPRIKYSRVEEASSVTVNWNRALKAASGAYVLMLGDDDALTPGLLTRLSALIRREQYPDVVYMMAFHFLYPNVDPQCPEGHFVEVANSELFLDERPHYRLDTGEAAKYARSAVGFRHEISFNAQHYVWRRDFTETPNDFFRPPYPDYFASLYTFARAGSIIVVPTASIIIGISKQSFGFFLINNQQEAGSAFFLETSEVDPTWQRDADISNAVRFPGPLHYRNWLLTALRFANEVDAGFQIDTDRYRRIQIVESLADAFCKGEASPPPAHDEWARFGSFASEVGEAFRRATSDIEDKNRLACVNSQKARILSDDLNVYPSPHLKDHYLANHNDIMDAFEFLTERGRERTAPAETARKGSRFRRIASSLVGHARTLASRLR